MLSYLPKWELRFYFLCHIVFVVYSIWNVFSFRNEIYRAVGGESFTEGLGGVAKEEGDSEWENFKTYIRTCLPWLLLHLVVSNLLKSFKLNRFLPVAFVLTGAAYLFMEIGFIAPIYLLLKVVPFQLLPKRFGGWGVSALAVLCLACSNLSKADSVYFWVLDHPQINHKLFFQMVVIDGWCTLKCISYALDKQDKGSDSDSTFSFVHFLGYVFYLPTLYLGPPIVYARFKTCFTADPQTVDYKKMFTTFFTNVFKVIVWFFILETSHHFLYLFSVQYAPEILRKFNNVCLFGYGYLLGQEFHLKYMAMYGFSGAFARWDGIDPPALPICVARVHKYSDMWKYFDRGLYEFLIKYIYWRFHKKSSGPAIKLFAMLLTFLFIYIWHGYFMSILVWSVLNCLGIFLEQLLNIIQRSSIYQQMIVGNFSESSVNRIDAVLGTHLLILAVISNFFFLANYDVGVLFLKRTYSEGVLNYIGISISLLFIYFTSEYCKRSLARAHNNIVKSAN